MRPDATRLLLKATGCYNGAVSGSASPGRAFSGLSHPTERGGNKNEQQGISVCTDFGCVMSEWAERVWKRRGWSRRSLWLGGTLFANLTSSAMNFDLNLNLSGDANSCDVTASWTDASGKAQTITVSPTLPIIVVATSLGAKDKVLWSSGSSGDGPAFQWQLEQAPAVSIEGQIGSYMGLQCGAGGTLYTNLTHGPVDLNLAASTAGCPITLSWTDAVGHAQTIAPGPIGSEGAATSLPAGGAISWTSGGATGAVSAKWQLERTPAHTSTGPATLVGLCGDASAGGTPVVLFSLGQTSSTTCSNFPGPPPHGVPMPSAGTLQNLHVTGGYDNAPGSGSVVTVYVNGSATDMTCTVGTSGKCADTTHKVSVHAGDEVAGTIALTSGAEVLVSLEKK